MVKWIPNPDPAAADIIDHVAHFRLNLADHHHLSAPDQVWWSVLIALDGVSIDGFEALAQDYADDLMIPAAYDQADRALVLPRQPVTIFARARLIERMNRWGNGLGVVSVLLGASVPTRFLDPEAQPQDLPEIVVPEGTVVQAVVDDGIALAHDLFRRDATTTRIHHAHLFETEPLAGGHATLGRGLEAGQIDALLRECTIGGMLDEDLFYARSGQVDLAQDVFSTVAMRRSHGTHVMALAAGDPMPEARADRPIICAALPSRIVADTTGFDMVPVLYLAFHILVRQARRFRTEQGAFAPVVFNFSYGNTGGPHDGTQVFAEMFDRYFGPRAVSPAGRRQRAWLTLPAGNANLDRLHAVAPHGSNRPVRLDLAVLPDDRTPSHVQIWLPVAAPGAVPPDAQITVRAPGGTDSGTIPAHPGQHTALVNARGERIAWLACQFVGGETKRSLVTLSINPTANIETGADLAPAGLWNIEIERPPQCSDGAFHIWVLRDDTLPGQMPGARQAFFDNPGYKRFDRFGAPLPVDPKDSDCPVRRSGTLSGFACADSPVVVAAYTAHTAELSGYSAAGPLNPSRDRPQPQRQGPDLAARGDDSLVRRGVISAGSRSGSWVRLSGTSVAAPQVARLATEDIASFDGTARNWAVQAVEQDRFPLRGDPSVTRTGAGAVAGKPFRP